MHGGVSALSLLTESVSPGALLTGVIAVVLLRTLRRLFEYDELATPEDAPDETGWKLVHADVFRKPHHSKLLAIWISTLHVSPDTHVT